MLKKKQGHNLNLRSLWFQYQAGRVMSSRVKAICHTNTANPAQSLVKSICYPLELSFSSKETQWGKNNEKRARNLYFKNLQLLHEDLVIADSGLVINPQRPSIAPCPDGVLRNQMPIIIFIGMIALK